MIIIGLTGSIGMGKSTIGAMMETLKIPVHESDQAVRALLLPDSPARSAISAAFPYYEHPEIYKGKNKDLNRKKFGDLVFNNDTYRKRLEAIMHPLVQDAQNDFIKAHIRKGVDMVCLDIPLLFETGAEKRVDYTITVSAPAHTQRERVLARDGMTEEKFEAILARQLPDAEKCKRSDYVIQNGLSRAHAMKQLKEIILDIREKTNPSEEEEHIHDT